MSTSANKVTLSGPAIFIDGNDIDTDQITPARFLKEITFDNMGNYLFYDARFDKNGTTLPHILNTPKAKTAKILIVGKNFGCGSSREHAPQAIKRFGFTAIIGESFAEIFAGNCKSLGIPTLTATPETLATLHTLLEKSPSEPVTVDLVTKTVSIETTSLPITINEAWRQAFITGNWNALAILKANLPKIQETNTSLPY